MKLRQFVEHETESVREFKEVFSFRKDRPRWNQWLQKMAFWALRKLQAWHQETITVREHRVPEGKLLKQIEEAKIDIMKHHRPDQMLLMGAKTYQDLMDDEDIRSSFMFRDEMVGYMNGHRRIFGIDIWVVPHVEGWAMVPKKPDVVLQ